MPQTLARRIGDAVAAEAVRRGVSPVVSVVDAGGVLVHMWRPDNTGKMEIATGAWWPFLSDGDYEVQSALGIQEYTDTHHRATVPYTVLLEPGTRRVAKTYCG